MRVNDNLVGAICLIVFSIALVWIPDRQMPGRLVSKDEAANVLGAAVCHKLTAGTQTICSTACGTATITNWEYTGDDKFTTTMCGTVSTCTDPRPTNGSCSSGS